MSIGQDIRSKFELAALAQEAGNYAQALAYVRSARMLITAVPKLQHGEEKIEYNLADIDLMIRDLEGLAAGTVGIQVFPVEYKRAE
jgi:hypothetical protein